jgi:hypothetical protein
MRATRLFLALASVVAIGLLTSPKNARALGPVEVEAAANVGTGSNPVGKPGFANALLAGVGGRVGVSFLEAYAGLNLEYHWSDSGTIFGDAVRGQINTLTFGAELGYNIRPIRVLTIRPQLGIGNAHFQLNEVSEDVPNLIFPGDSNYLYLEPGIVCLLSFGAVLVGVDAGLLWLPTASDRQVAYTLNRQLVTDTSIERRVAFTSHVELGVRF